MNKLPEPKHRLGYPASQLNKLIEELGYTKEQFAEAFGVNTAALDEDTGEVIYYVTDVQRALYKLGNSLGIHFKWD